MEAIGIASSALSVVPLLIRIVVRTGHQYRSQRFGSYWGTILYLTGLIDTDALQQRHRDINFWTDEEVLAWKSSHLAFCNAIAVAVRLFILNTPWT